MGTRQKFKKFLRYSLSCIGKLWWYVYPKKLSKVDILCIFKFADAGGSEKVQENLVKVFKDYNVLVLITHKGKNKRFFRRYQRYSKVVDISRYTDSIVGRWIAAGYLHQVITKSNIPIVFGSLSGLIYDVALLKRTIDKTTYIDIFHALDGNLEFYSLDSVPYLTQRVAIDKKVKEDLTALYDRAGLSEYKHQIVQITNGVVIPERMLFNKKHFNKKMKVLYVGRDSPEKRVYLLKKIAQQLPSIDFIFVGVDPGDSDPNNVFAQGIQDNVETYYKQADILILASKREGFPMVVMEAMSYGVIPVVSDVGGLKSHIKTGYNGFLISNDTNERMVQDFVKVLSDLERDRDRKESMSQRAYTYAKEHFDLKRFEQEYKNLLRQYITESKK